MGHWQIQDEDYLGCLIEGSMTDKPLVVGLIPKIIEKGGWFLEGVSSVERQSTKTCNILLQGSSGEPNFPLIV